MLHFSIFKLGSPVSERIKRRSRRKSDLDSLYKLYPELDSPQYYHQIMNKAFSPLAKPFTYSKTSGYLEEGEFQTIVDELNKAGFWDLCIEEPCKWVAADGSRFFIEFCSGKKYVLMSFQSGCENEKIDNLRSLIRTIISRYDLDGKLKI